MVDITLTDVSIDIPIYDVGGASLRKAVLQRTIGGRFAQTGSHVIVKALKNLSFDAHEGDRIAIVGDNGSGKSTLLRVLSRVYPPTSGVVRINGSISPLFDATLGMNMDATGIENIWMSGTIWGLSRTQIANSIDDVADFTDLGDFLQVPVRTYSTGMMLRLAFAIATLREPEILLIDEVIGVGDGAFFAKAFARLEDVVRRSKILVVASHVDDILRKLCNKGMWLSHGSLVIAGPIEEVLTAYRGNGAALGGVDKSIDARVAN